MTHCPPRRRFALAAGTLALAGCAGVPVTTVARLATKGPDYLLDAQPLDLRVGLDVDERLKASATKSPVLVAVLRSGDGPPVLERNIPLVVDTTPSDLQGLPSAGARRAWALARPFEALRARRSSANNVSVIKEALAQLGVCERTVRPPISELPTNERAEVTTILSTWGVAAHAAA